MKAYIDESGEPKEGKGTRWLVFGCVMVSENEAATARQVAVDVANTVRGPGTNIHFKEMGHEAKIQALQLFKEASWYGILLARDKTKSRTDTPPRPTRVLYQTMIAYVLERVSGRAGSLGESTMVYIEESNHLARRRVAEFRQFIEGAVQRGRFNIDLPINANRSDSSHSQTRGTATSSRSFVDCGWTSPCWIQSS